MAHLKQNEVSLSDLREFARVDLDETAHDFLCQRGIVAVLRGKLTTKLRSWARTPAPSSAVSLKCKTEMGDSPGKHWTASIMQGLLEKLALAVKLESKESASNALQGTCSPWLKGSEKINELSVCLWRR